METIFVRKTIKHSCSLRQRTAECAGRLTSRIGQAGACMLPGRNSQCLASCRRQEVARGCAIRLGGERSERGADIECQSAIYLFRNQNKEGIYVSIVTTTIKLLIILGYAVLFACGNYCYQSAVNTKVFVNLIYYRETVLKTRIHYKWNLSHDSAVASQYLLNVCLGGFKF
jgi:hypothetical protein